jgi:hypothetical protein
MNTLQPIEKTSVRFFILPDLCKGMSMTSEDVIGFVARELKVSPDEAGNRIASDMAIENRDFIRHDIIVCRRSGVLVAMKYIDPIRRQQISTYFNAGTPVAIMEPIQEDPAQMARIAATNQKRLATIKINKARRLAAHGKM